MSTRPAAFVWCFGLALAVASTLSSSSADARSRVAVLPLQADRSVPERRSNEAREELRRALVEKSYAALASVRVDRLLLATDLSCRSPSCLARTAALLKADLLVGGRLERSSGEPRRPCELGLWMFDARQTATVATVQARCASGEESLPTLVRSAVKRLLAEAASRLPARLIARSTPPGASVSVDGSPVGVTELSFGLLPGRHTVALQLEGYALAVHHLAAAPGATLTVDARLVPLSAETAPPAKRRSMRWAKWVLGAGALVAVGIGAGLWATGQNELGVATRGSEPDQTRDLRPAGMALTISGAALAVGAAVGFWLDGRQR